MTGSSTAPESLVDIADPSTELLSLIATGRARTRAELVSVTGLSRSTVGKRLQQLLDANLVDELGSLSSSGGRPARHLTFNRSNGIAIGVDIGEDHTRVAVTDLTLELLAQSTTATNLADGPAAVLDLVIAQISSLCKDIGRGVHEIVGICLAVPAPVDWDHGTVVGPSVMPGWDGYDIRGAIKSAYDVPVMVDNDVNLLGLAEARAHRSDARVLLYIKAGTGIGSAVLINGELFRGANGAAGDIGHIHLHADSEPLCRCGNLGCVEANAGGWAIARDLRAAGIEADVARDVVTLADQGRPEAIRMLREAGRAVGEAAAAAISVLNPDVLVLGGVLAGSGSYLLTGVQEIVYRRCLPLSTGNLTIKTGTLGDLGGVLGAAQLVVDQLLRLPGSTDKADRTVR